jgi:hypothetical protein
MIDLNDDRPIETGPIPADKLAELLRLPPLPEIDTKNCIGYDAIRYVPGYTEDFVKRYAIEYARKALANH